MQHSLGAGATHTNDIAPGLLGADIRLGTQAFVERVAGHSGWRRSMALPGMRSSALALKRVFSERAIPAYSHG